MRTHNFGAGPCTLPSDVLAEAAEELVDFEGSGMSLLEMSHRSPVYDRVHRATLDAFRRVAGVPDDMDVLFVQGGASLQFAMAPMNLLGPAQRAGYVLTGTWAKGAFGDAAAVADVYPAWDGADSSYTTAPAPDALVVEHGSRYVHITTNETIGGIRLPELPETDVPLVADMSSDVLTRSIDWSRFDLAYAGVQKNLAPAGMAVIVIRKGVEADASQRLPRFLRYRWHADADSLAHTPPMFPIWIMGKVLRRIEERGGVAGLEARTARKAETLYRVIDESDGFYRSPVDPSARSHTNVVFRLATQDLEAEFRTEAERRDIIGLKGHRSVGGMRASLYAALEQPSVDALAELMEGFAADHR